MIARCLATGLQDPPEASFNDVEISLVTKLQQGQQALDRSLHDALNGLPGNQDYHRFGGDASNRTQSPTEIASLDGKENLGNDEFLNGTHQEMLGDGSKRKKGASASQANDVELRRLFKANEHRDLRDVAMEVLKDNKGPKSEKAKQVFGMLW
jgi:regulatory factor X